ncbi:MAG TPA: hypothetical protein VGE98_04275 [Thermoanaerobaculia bacterium]
MPRPPAALVWRREGTGGSGRWTPWLSRSCRFFKITLSRPVDVDV